MKLDIAVIPGDGIGPEIVREARKVLDLSAPASITPLTGTKPILLGE